MRLRIHHGADVLAHACWPVRYPHWLEWERSLCRCRATRVAGNIIDAFFDDEKYLAARIRAQFEIMIVRGLKFQSNISRSKRFAGKPPHSFYQLTKAILAGVDGPNNVTHGIDQFA